MASDGNFRNYIVKEWKVLENAFGFGKFWISMPLEVVQFSVKCITGVVKSKLAFLPYTLCPKKGNQQAFGSNFVKS